MTFEPDAIVQNALSGTGPCTGCPAQADTGGEFVTPGLINPTADVMFVTMDPSHRTDWSKHKSWEEYNNETAQKFIRRWPGGKAISRLLNGVPGVRISGIWLADAIKCPVNNDLAGDVDVDEAFRHCRSYLIDEIATVDPRVIVAMGNDPAEQLLNGIYDLDVGSIRAGTTHAGKTYETDPPVVVSPHWANGWLGRHNNRKKVRTAINSMLVGHSDTSMLP